MNQASRIYEGTVRHRRFRPVKNSFEYRIYMMYLDLNELPELFQPYWLWSAKKRAVAEFRTSDYHGQKSGNLAERVRKTLVEKLKFTPEGPIRILTHMRYFGYIFNPVSFYFCFDSKAKQVEAIMTEITNTPWGDRYSYALDLREQRAQGKRIFKFRFPKQFHVSPFMPLDMEYDWRFSDPGERLSIHMQNFSDNQKVFDATLKLVQRPIKSTSLASVLTRYPLMTIKVISAIHWQALKLYLKKAIYYPHPENGLRKNEDNTDKTI